MKTLTIGNLELSSPYLLAPMAGVTDLPFRLLCKEMGAGLLTTEMVSAKAILYGNKNTDILLKSEPTEHPLAVQVFGSDPEIVGSMAAKIEKDFEIVDFNMGCPVPKIVNNREGSALMKDPKQAEAVMKALVKHVSKPVTVKIRKGFDDAHVNAVEIAKIAESCGVSAITVHGRTREQYYTGKADWDIIRQVKEAVSIPVIGNGDIFTGADGLAMMEKTGCDGVMIGRGSKGNPWIFRDLLEYDKTGKLPERPGAAEVKAMILRHAQMQIEYKGEFMGIREMRKHVAWYTVGMKHSSSLRNRVNAVETMEEFLKLMEELA